MRTPRLFHLQSHLVIHGREVFGGHAYPDHLQIPRRLQNAMSNSGGVDHVIALCGMDTARVKVWGSLFNEEIA